MQLLEHALIVDPTRRIQSIEELRKGLREALDPRNLYRLNTPISGVRVVERDRKPSTGQTQLPPPQVVAKPSNAKRWIGIASIVAVLVTIGVVAIVLAT